MSWSIVDYMIKERRDQFRGLIKLLNKRPSFRMAFIEVFGTDDQRTAMRKMKHDQQLDEAYRHATQRFETDWKAWIKGQSEYADSYNNPAKRKARPKREFPGDAEKKKDGKGKKKKKKRRRRRTP